jgi:hypothetical protein
LAFPYKYKNFRPHPPDELGSAPRVAMPCSPAGYNFSLHLRWPDQLRALFALRWRAVFIPRFA